MKYKASRDIPKFARKYKTVDSKKLASIISMALNTIVEAESIRAWLRRHPTVNKELTDYIGKKLKADEKESTYEKYLNQRVLAELYVNDFKDLEITDLETVNLARIYLDFVEQDLKIKICKQLNLKVIRK